jgi:2-polyprenyl-6-hydroxyphenyl methylase/3-demethylubiquinone-9 3-methyltransferase
VTEPDITRPSHAGLAFQHHEPAHTHAYLWPVVERLLPPPKAGPVLDLGCGNGAFTARLHSLGYQVKGIDPSPSGIALARALVPDVAFIESPAVPELANSLDRFVCVIALEVIEHIPEPRVFAQTVRRLLAPGGTAIISTPYHGYWKNLALALTGQMDRHFTALWDGGHVKFWSVKTLSQLFAEQNLFPTRIIRVGRIPCLAKSMVLVFQEHPPAS